MFSHGWPLNGDAWEHQMLFLAQNGFRTIAHDRRGHGRSSSQPWIGNDMDTYADDTCSRRFCFVWWEDLVQTPGARSKSARSAFSTSPKRAPVRS